MMILCASSNRRHWMRSRESACPRSWFDCIRFSALCLECEQVLQEAMGERVQMQQDFLAGLEVDRRDWNRFRTQVVKTRASATKKKFLLRRLHYGESTAGVDCGESQRYDGERTTDRETLRQADMRQSRLNENRGYDEPLNACPAIGGDDLTRKKARLVDTRSMVKLAGTRIVQLRNVN